MTSDLLRAACVTAPAAGGVAVVQIVGPSAASVLAPLLKSRRPLDLEKMDAGELRLCRFMDGQEVIDDALVSIRRLPNGEYVVDLSLHGGPRIVQRVLLRLKQSGVKIVEGSELLAESWPEANRIEQEALAILLKVKTRAVAAWVLEMKEHLSHEIERIRDAITAGNLAPARSALDELCSGAERVQYLLDGVRVVLLGRPNVGKSTLANALAERESAIVSEAPGTTRDFVEHPAAIDGVPFTIVDTAGVRESDDPIEQEAIRRTRQQLETGDLVVQLFDASAAPIPDERADAPDLLVWNKCDQAIHPEQMDLIRRAGDRAVRVSALTREGIDLFRERILECAGLTGWRTWRSPFTQRQVTMCQQALSALDAQPPGVVDALNFLESILVNA